LKPNPEVETAAGILTARNRRQYHRKFGAMALVAPYSPGSFP